MQSLMKVWVVIFYKAQNDMHAPAALQKLSIGYLVFEPLKLKFRAHNLFNGFLKGLI